MKKVLVYKTNLLGFSETFIKEQVLALQEWHPVLVGVKQTNELDLNGIDLCLLGDLRQGRWQRFRWRLARHFDLPPPAVVARLAAQGAQLVHIHFGTEAVLFWPMAKALNVPVFITLHGFDINTRREWWEAGHGGHWMRKYPERLLRIAADERVTFVAVSDDVRDRAVAFGIPAERVVVRHIGIDTRKFVPRGVPVGQRRPRVLFAGRLVENKGVEVLVRAFARTHDAIPEAELVIAGDGPLRRSLETLAREFGCPVSFLGAVAPDEIRAQMDLARVLSLPSVTIGNGNSEGFGMVILEAQACGVPVVTSSRGGVRRGIVDGETGFAHAEGDVDRLASCLVRLLTDDALAERFSAAARAHVERNFDIRDCTRQLEQTYDQALARFPGRNGAGRG